MTKLALTLILAIASTAYAVELDKASLKRALHSDKSVDVIKKTIKNLAAHGADGAKVLAKSIGKDNLTYFIMTTNKEDLKGMDLRIKGPMDKQHVTLLNKLVKDWRFVDVSEIQRLAVGKTTGSFFVDNDCLRGTFLFEMDAKGNVVKLAIPRLGTKSMRGALVVFEKK